jgi:hypothetical protein
LSDYSREEVKAAADELGIEPPAMVDDAEAADADEGDTDDHADH